MKLLGNKSCVVVLLHFFGMVHAEYQISNNFFRYRSFTSYSFQDLVQERELFNPKDDHLDQTVMLSTYTSYGRSFKLTSDCCKNLGARPFWSGSNIMTVGNGDGRADLDGYQLGLGNVKTNDDGIAGVIKLNPQVTRIASDIMLYYCRGKNKPGMFFKFHLPIESLSLRTNFTEPEKTMPDNIVSFQQVTQDPNSTLITYQYPDYPLPHNRYNSVYLAMTGGAVSSFSVRGNSSKILHLEKGRMSVEQLVLVGLGDVSFTLGYNLYANKKGFFGAGLKVSCPTTKPPTADYCLEPILGRGGQWAFGLECTGLYRAWDKMLHDSYIDVWWQAELLHISPGRRQSFRSFDLKLNGPGSKYLLVQNYSDIFTFNGVTTDFSIYPQKLIYAINLTTLPVQPVIAAEGSLACLVDYHKGGLQVACGVEVWGRTREQLFLDIRSLLDDRHPDLNNYAVMGRQISKYSIDDYAPVFLQTNYCEPLARINKSQDPITLIGNPAIDLSAQEINLPSGIKNAALSTNRIPSMYVDSLDIEGASAPAAVSASLFTQLGYSWEECFYIPTLAVLASVEFSNTSVDWWSIGIQGTLNF